MDYTKKKHASRGKSTTVLFLRSQMFLLLLLILLIVTVCDCVSEEPNNVALKKTCFQSSGDYYRGEEWRAVDGNSLDTTWRGYSDDNTCTHTDKDFPSWWMVDLLKEHYVTSVQLTNRADELDPETGQVVGEFGKRLSNFTIEMSLADPRYMEAFPGVIASLEVCFKMDGAVPSGATVLYHCQKPILARFIRVVKYNSDPEMRALTLCEFEAYDIRGWKFGHPTHFTDAPDILKIFSNIRSKLDCARLCAAKSGGESKVCKGLQFHVPTGVCQLLGYTHASDTAWGHNWQVYVIR